MCTRALSAWDRENNLHLHLPLATSHIPGWLCNFCWVYVLSPFLSSASRFLNPQMAHQSYQPAEWSEFPIGWSLRPHDFGGPSLAEFCRFPLPSGGYVFLHEKYPASHFRDYHGPPRHLGRRSSGTSTPCPSGLLEQSVPSFRSG